MAGEYWVWFSELNIDLRSKLALLDAFFDPQMLYEATPSVLAAADVPLPMVTKLMASRDLKRAERIVRACEKDGIALLPLLDPRYPERLRNIDDPPVLLYTRGVIPDFDHAAALTVVGTRRAPKGAVDIASRFARELAENEMLIVSGLATGIDLAANTAAIQACGCTAAVLGCGLDICYPESSRPVYESILSGNGCLLSEYPPGTPPLGRHFPIRNRIMSGLSLGVLVVAAPERSGSLITAHRAADQGRDVFVIPGGIDDAMFAGSNGLIKQGAEAVTDPYDILSQYIGRYPDYFRMAGSYFARLRAHAEKEESEKTIPAAASPLPVYRVSPVPKPEPKKKEKTDPEELFPDVWPTLGDTAQRIARTIAAGSTQIDDIVETTGLSTAQILQELTLLEMEGVVRSLPGKHFEITE